MDTISPYDEKPCRYPISRIVRLTLRYTWIEPSQCTGVGNELASNLVRGTRSHDSDMLMQLFSTLRGQSCDF